MDTEAPLLASADAPPEVVRALVHALPAAVTPLRALARVERLPHTVFLESGGPVGEASDWTLLLFDPAWRLALENGVLARTDVSGTRPLPGPPLAALAAAWPESAEIAGAPPIPFLSGLAGYLAYDLKDWIERYPARARRDLPIPDLALGFYDVVWAWRRSTGEGWVVATGLGAPAGEAPRRREEAARSRLQSQWSRIVGPTGPDVDARPEPAMDETPPRRDPGRVAIESNFTRDGYRRMVETALEHIAAGDIYQVNLAQRFRAPGLGDAAAVFRSLRRAAPAPFLAYVALDAQGGGIASSSPERFFRVEGGTGPGGRDAGRRIETWPIKGTRPRGGTPESDAALAAELLRSEKDRAENVMIVDLERNDLGRVCAIGSVRVPWLCEVSSHSNVHHLVSRVEGTLRPDVGPVDVLRALFPGGSITGAPKIRSVQIIDALEPVRRGIYTGAIGYWDVRGGCDWNIAIRTIVASGGAAFFHAGGGVVADSTPEGEYEETLVKASGMMRALGFL